MWAMHFRILAEVVGHPSTFAYCFSKTMYSYILLCFSHTTGEVFKFGHIVTNWLLYSVEHKMRKSVVLVSKMRVIFKLFVILTECVFKVNKLLSKPWLISHFDLVSHPIQIWMSDIYVSLTKEHASFMLTTWNENVSKVLKHAGNMLLTCQNVH